MLNYNKRILLDLIYIRKGSCKGHFLLFTPLSLSYCCRITSLIYYLSAAESGFEAAQFNVAYLCELNSVSPF